MYLIIIIIIISNLFYNSINCTNSLCLQKVYITYVGQLKRIDSVRRSPIYAHFDESIVGANSIRAYRKEKEFITKCDRLINESLRPFYLILVSQRSVFTLFYVITGGSGAVWSIAEDIYHSCRWPEFIHWCLQGKTISSTITDIVLMPTSTFIL